MYLLINGGIKVNPSVLAKEFHISINSHLQPQRGHDCAESARPLEGAMLKFFIQVSPTNWLGKARTVCFVKDGRIIFSTDL